MNKEQQSLDELRALVHSELDGTRMLDEYLKHCDTLQKLVDQQVILEEYNVTPEILREVLLTGQMFRNQPTLDECIKMWEEKDFIVDNSKLCIHLEHIQYQVDMFIHKEEKKYHVHYGYISLELNELLTKTLKALEVNKND